MATVGETLFLAFGVDTSTAVKGVADFQKNIQDTTDTAVNSARKLETDLQNSLNNVNQGAKQINETLQQSAEQTKQTGNSLESLTKKWGGALTGLFTSILAPIAGAMTAGAVLKGYFSDVAQVAQMTGAYSTKMEEWRKKRNMLARVNREDIELYKKIREGMFKFNESMANVSATIMRTISPAIKFMVGLLDKFSNWINSNQNNIVRFIKILAVTISVALIPSLIRLGKTLLFNPLTWIIASIAGLIIVIDDLITYINGGDSALSGLWSVFGTGEEIGNALKSTLGALTAVLMAIGKPLGVVLLGFSAFKTASAVIGGVVKGVHALRSALTVLTAHPIVAFLTLIIGLIMWIVDAFNRAGGDWSKVFDIMLQDVIDFLNYFGGFGDVIKKVWSKAFEGLTNIISAFVNFFKDTANVITDENTSLLDKIKNIFKLYFNFVTNVFNEIYEYISMIFGVILKPIDNALNGALSNTFNKFKEIFTNIRDYIISVFTDAFNFFSNGIDKVKNAITGTGEKIKGWFGFGDEAKTATETANAVKLTDIATSAGTANNYNNRVNKSVVQNINVDARGSEEQAGAFVASLTQDTDDYNNYSNNAQTAQF